MAGKKTAGGDLAQVLRNLALRYPEVEESIACAGTAVESATFKARNKAFLFLRAVDRSHQLRVKLRESQAEAIQLASLAPARYQSGAHGWTAVTFSEDDAPSRELLERWIDESYRIVVDKKLVALLPERSIPTARKKPTAR